MYVFYDEGTGAVKFTANGSDDITLGRTNWIEVEAQDLGDLTAWAVTGGVLELVSLAPMKRDFIAEVNSTIGELRRQYITTIPGQETIYALKKQEAQAYIADGAPNMDNYPFLSEERGVTAATAYQVAQVWLNKDAIWRTMASNIEGHRIKYARFLEVAATVEALTTLMNNFRAMIVARS